MRPLVSFSRVKKIAILTFEGSTKDTLLPWGTCVSEHRFNGAFLSEFRAAVESISSNSDIDGLVITGKGRFFSNGFDLDWFKRISSREAYETQKDLELLMAKILSLSIPTVAALNGHTVAAGAALALACDFRLMTNDALFFIPAVDLGLRYSPGFVELVKLGVSDQAKRRDLLLFSKRFRGQETVEAGIVDKVIDNHQLLSTAIELAQANAKQHRSSVAAIKAELYKDALDALLHTSDERRDMGWSDLKKRTSSKL